MKNKKQKIIKASAAVMDDDTIQSHQASGHVTLGEHYSKMHRAVSKAIQEDERFNRKAAPQTEGIPYNQKPHCVDITTCDEDDKHHAIIRTADGKLVRHPFDFNHDEGTCTMADGEPCETESTHVYATAIERYDNMLKATNENLISCRYTGGVKLGASEPWEPGKGVSYIYVPGGITTINAGFRKNESITCTVCVDKDTAKDLQDSFDYIAATEKQEPYADEDHESKKATLRFPPSKVQFTYGSHRGEEGVIVQGAEPTSYGAEAVNGKVYASWSPEFATDADYSKAKCRKGHWTFPDGVRGSASNPARIVAVNFVTGALTNKPAFKNMPPVKAKHVDPKTGELVEDDTVQATWSDAAREAANEARKSKMHSEAHGFSSLAHEATERAGSANNKQSHSDAAAAHEKAYQAHSDPAVGNHDIAKHHDMMRKSHEAAYGTAKATDSERGNGTPDDERDRTKARPLTEYQKSALREHGYHAATSPAAGDTVKAAATPGLDAIFARVEAERKAADSIAMKDAAVQAREAEKAKPADTRCDEILARKQKEREFEASLLARNPVLAHRDGLDSIVSRQSGTGTGTTQAAPNKTELETLYARLTGAGK